MLNRSKLLKFKAEIFSFFFFVFVRSFSLGDDIFNTDVWKWKARIFNFSNGVFTLDFAETVQRYHPGVTLMWLGTFAVKINNLYLDLFNPTYTNLQYVFTLHFFQKLVIVLFLGITLSFIVFALRKLQFRSLVIFIFILLVSFEPFILAMTRVIHLEGILAFMMFGSYVYYLVYLKSPSKFSLVLSAFFGALAILNKSPALFLFPFFGLITFIYYNFDFKNTIKVYFKWLPLCLLMIFILWPALWVIPSEVFSNLWRGISDTGIEDGHSQIYFGKYVVDPGISFYPVALALRISFISLITFLFSFKYLYQDLKNKSYSSIVVLNFLFILLYLIEMSIPTKKLDRYLLPVLLPLLLSSSVVLERVSLYFDRYKKYVFVLLVSSGLALNAFILHPDYFSFYSRVFGGLSHGIFIIEPKWLIGKTQIEEKVLELIEKENFVKFEDDESLDVYISQNELLMDKMLVGFPEKYYTQVYPFIARAGARATIKDITAQAVHTNYFIYPVWEDTSKEENRFKIEQIDTINLRGVPIYNVYKKVQ